MKEQLVDQFGRKHEYLRISITDACNLRCVYCVSGKMNTTVSSKMMTREEIFKIASTFVGFGINKIRLTGGEPLVRKDVRAIIKDLSELPAELCISSNGLMIDQFIDSFIDGKIKSVNVSLDSLDENIFENLTKNKGFHKILENIKLLLDQNISTKINIVILRGINDFMINDFIELTRDLPLEVRFIEFMPFSGNSWALDKVFTLDEILRIASKKFVFEKLPGKLNDTAKNFKITGFKGSFGIISTITNPFCGDCNRLRITADGKLKNCLFSKTETDLLSPLRNNQDLREHIQSNIITKAWSLGGQELNEMDNRSMIKIGG